MGIELASLNTGAPRDLAAADGRAFRSSIARSPVGAPMHCSLDGLPGDGCEYRLHHDRERAINLFDLADYAALEALLGRPLSVPAFGENLTTRGYPTAEARVGDRLRVGGALIEVSHPREPCGNITRLHDSSKIVKWMRDECLTGCYARVVEPGAMAPDSSIALESRGPAAWTIAALDRAMFRDIEDEAQGAALMALAVLSPNWKRSYAEQFAKRTGRALQSPATEAK